MPLQQSEVAQDEVSTHVRAKARDDGHARAVGRWVMPAAVALGATLACGGSDAPMRPDHPTDLAVEVRLGSLEAPDTVAAGWSRLRVREDTLGHIVVLFQLTGTPTPLQLPAFLAALDSSATTPPQAKAMGGPEMGDSGEVIVELAPGRYVLGCVARGKDRHRHAAIGEAKLVVVVGSAAHGTPAARGGAPRTAPPVMTQEVRMVDFAYVGPDRWPPGRHVLGVRNDGQQDHQLRLVRLRPGSTIQSWAMADEPSAHGTEVAGVARTGAGRVAYLEVDLPPGEYVAYCLIAVPGTRNQHIDLGMLRAIRVE